MSFLPFLRCPLAQLLLNPFPLLGCQLGKPSSLCLYRSGGPVQNTAKSNPCMSCSNHLASIRTLYGHKRSSRTLLVALVSTYFFGPCFACGHHLAHKVGRSPWKHGPPLGLHRHLPRMVRVVGKVWGTPVPVILHSPPHW